MNMIKKALCLALLIGLFSGEACVPGYQVPKDRLISPKTAAARVLFFVADGMRPDLMESYARQGFLPAYSKLMDRGVRQANGMIPAFSTNSGVCWYTLATGLIRLR